MTRTQEAALQGFLAYLAGREAPIKHLTTVLDALECVEEPDVDCSCRADYDPFAGTDGCVCSNCRAWVQTDHLRSRLRALLRSFGVDKPAPSG